MLEFINSIDLSENLKINEIYNIFKTNSLEFNSDFLLILKKYSTTREFISHYTKIDIKNIITLFNDITISSSKIINEENNNIFNSDIESYLYGISRIILLLYLIVKNNNLLHYLVKSTKQYINNFYSMNKKDSLIKGKLDAFIYDILSLSQRSNSRRSTNDKTSNTNLSVSSINCDNKNNVNFILLNKLQMKNSDISSNKNNNHLLRSLTPRFEDLENTEQKNNNSTIKDFKEENSKEPIIKIDSSLTLQKMNFVQLEEENEEKKKIKKSISYKIKKNSCDKCQKTDRKKNKSKSIKVRQSLFNKTRRGSVNINYEENQNERIKLIAEFFDSINILYKNGKINSVQKIRLKQIIISNPRIIIEQFNKKYSKVNKDSNKILLTNKIQIFLLENFSYL